MTQPMDGREVVVSPITATESQQRAIELLARESQRPINEVARLYEAQRVGLEAGARITAFVPILAIRKVREVLRRHRAGKLPST